VVMVSVESTTGSVDYGVSISQGRGDSKQQ